VQVTHEYAVAPNALLDVLSDPAFLAARGEKFGATGDSVVTRDGAAVTITTPRQLPLDQVPAAFRGFVGSGTIVQTDELSATGDGVSGTFAIDAGAAPVKIWGTHEITPASDGSSYTISATIKASVPFIGGAIESQVAGYLNKLIVEEQAFAADWIASHA
jgi:hypothetical protein